ncbi:MAG: hypothetical protein HY269_07750 [Deltaproteobacteria bacterium]|nr:hypothetical protein [Deltaproteobacteria bacterium]
MNPAERWDSPKNLRMLAPGKFAVDDAARMKADDRPLSSIGVLRSKSRDDIRQFCGKP